MTFDEWIAAYAKEHSGARVDMKRDMAACWNAAVEACEEIVSENYDEMEPWLRPGDLTESVGVKAT